MIQRTAAMTQQIKDQKWYSKDDFYLCQGLLSIYLKLDDSKQVIHY